MGPEGLKGLKGLLGLAGFAGLMRLMGLAVSVGLSGFVGLEVGGAGGRSGEPERISLLMNSYFQEMVIICFQDLEV